MNETTARSEKERKHVAMGFSFLAGWESAAIFLFVLFVCLFVFQLKSKVWNIFLYG